MRIPEWFLGGPAHGQDKQVLLKGQSEPGDKLFHRTLKDPDEHVYIRRTYCLGDTQIALWVSTTLSTFEAESKLAEILLAPHKIDDT